MQLVDSSVRQIPVKVHDENVEPTKFYLTVCSVQFTVVDDQNLPKQTNIIMNKKFYLKLISRKYTTSTLKGKYDAVVVGGGHNGLTSLANKIRSGPWSPLLYSTGLLYFSKKFIISFIKINSSNINKINTTINSNYILVKSMGLKNIVDFYQLMTAPISKVVKYR
uniref:Pyr_redox_2 domain-containing protein n=1 Tax=Heterorhabditis bacteriophora TaxID=37862 RepID=A0A1I7WM34_HETBA